MKLYCLAQDTGKGWTELRFKCSETTATRVKNAKAGLWYRVPSSRSHDFGVLQEGTTYVVTCDEAWVDQREAQIKYNVVRVTGNVSVEEYHKPVETPSQTE